MERRRSSEVLGFLGGNLCGAIVVGSGTEATERFKGFLRNERTFGDCKFWNVKLIIKVPVGSSHNEKVHFGVMQNLVIRTVKILATEHGNARN